jgi:hypothetical protein
MVAGLTQTDAVMRCLSPAFRWRRSRIALETTKAPYVVALRLRYHLGVVEAAVGLAQDAGDLLAEG